MRQLPVRFADKQWLQVKDLSEKNNIDQSQVARAAMQLGLEILRGDIPKGFEVNEYVAINNLKALN